MTPDADEAPLRSANDVAWRALALGAALFRALLERAEQADSDPERRRANERIMLNFMVWMAGQKISRRQSPAETRAFAVVLGRWDLRQSNALIWRAEALGALLWALGSQDSIPGYDQPFDASALMAQIPIFDLVEPFVTGAALRPEAEIRQAREIAEIWHWRARLALLPGEIATEEDPLHLARSGAQVLAEEGLIEPLGGDFPAFGKPYHQISESEGDTAYGIARERHHALNWLCGYGADWDSTPTDT